MVSNIYGPMRYKLVLTWWQTFINLCQVNYSMFFFHTNPKKMLRSWGLLNVQNISIYIRISFKIKVKEKRNVLKGIIEHIALNEVYFSFFAKSHVREKRGHRIKITFLIFQKTNIWTSVWNQNNFFDTEEKMDGLLN